jgi:microsomal dipeptidase-like Zn-dependent dipeptidase
MNWKELHNESTVVDLHSHSMLKRSIFNRDLSRREGKWLAKWFKESFWPFSERATFPKIDDGGLDVILSTAYVLEQGWIDDISLIDWLLWLTPSVRKRVVEPSYFDATVAMIEGMESQIEAYNNSAPKESRKIKVAYSPQEILENIEQNIISVVHSVEGAHSLQGDISGKYTIDQAVSSSDIITDWSHSKKEILENLEHFHKMGAAYLGIAHFYPNHCVDPVFPYPEYGAKHMDWRKALGKWDETTGLTDIGFEVVEKMLDLGMIIDISHCTLKARKQIYDIVSSQGKSECVVASHVGAFECNRLSYNLQDWELKWFADHGCVAGIIFMNYWISSVDSGLGLKYIEQTLNHIINVCGTDTAAIGTDFDGFTDPPDEIVDMSELPRITCYLKGLDYDDDVIKKFLGKNALRLLTNGWHP